ncbi:uncharacterized protein LOC117645805 [Thrips palmi]|uniref:Uncharacterized protein LOC117645805 n=1 Tax=Thrips palmi TaxID=161013 RepID=A0A6P8Z635_THRPL|nr:uncharacterized protein LOC117645805 [Thrips palmi]
MRRLHHRNEAEPQDDPSDGFLEFCGGNLTAPKGVIHSPNFPGPFPVPLHCRWVIDASAYVKPVVVVYLTQVYVLNGLNFYAYALYGRTRMGETKVHSVAPSNVTTTHWLSSKYPYLVVDLSLDRLEGNHLRVLSHLQDAFGFNVTYEVREGDETPPCSPSSTSSPSSPTCCNPMQCSFVGDCLADANFTRFYCACPEGHDGPDCGLGPKCRDEPGICRNGGTCKSLGAESIRCDCVDNYSGPFCEVAPVDEEDRECHSDGGTVCNCTGGSRVVSDRSRYLAEVRLAGPADPDADPHYRENLNRTFTRNMTDYLENSNVSVVVDLHVVSIVPAADAAMDLTFRVVCGRWDLAPFKAALDRLVDSCRDCLGSMRLAAPPRVPDPEPLLHLLELRSNIRSGVVHEGNDFILSCVARGATSMQFSWYKDGVLINASLARRNMLTPVQSMGQDALWSALLVVESTSWHDAGRFTCRVVDAGSEQCRSVDVRVRSPPRLAVRPLVHTIRAGTAPNVTTCCYTGADKVGVTWTRDRALLEVKPGKEVEEDLEYPPGSLLRLYNVKVGDVDGGVDHHGQEALGRSEHGQAAHWDEPDFSECVQEEFAFIRDNFVRLTLGYANTTALQTLKEVRQWLEARLAADTAEDGDDDDLDGETYDGLRPREGQPVLDLVVDVAAYQRKVLGARKVLQLREELFRIVDALLLHRHAVRDNAAIEEVQGLVREQALLWASSLPSPLSSASSSSSSARSASAALLPAATYTQMEVHVVGANDLDEATRAKGQGVPLPEWVGGSLKLHVSKALLSNRSLVAAVVAFKSLHKLLPERSIAELPDNSELEYELASSLVSVSLGSEAGDLVKDVAEDGVDFGADVVLLVTVPAGPAYSWPRWGVSCGVADIARGMPTTRGPLPWNTTACATLPVDWDPLGSLGSPHDLRSGTFSLRCNCTAPGTIAVLLTSNTSESAVPLGPRPPAALLSGLALCALQAGAAFLVLLPRWLSRPSCMQYLKLQSAAASSASAGVFLTGLTVSSSAGPGLVAALHSCLLTALTAHLAQLLLLYTEVVGVRPLPHLRQSLLAVAVGAPLGAVLCGQVAARSVPAPSRLHHGHPWAPWAPWGTRLCTVLVATAAIILVAFGMLLCVVVVRIARDARGKEEDGQRKDRWGMLRRSCAIVLCQVAVVALSIAFVSVKSSAVCYVFSASAATLGAVTLLCYVVRPEGPSRPSPSAGLRDAGALADKLRGDGGAATTIRTAPDPAGDASQTEPLTSRGGADALRSPWRPLRAALAKLCWLCCNVRSYQLVPPPCGPDTPTPARLGADQTPCPFIVFTKQDAELESEAAADAETHSRQHAAVGAANGKPAAVPMCTCHTYCTCPCVCHSVRYVPMCPTPVSSVTSVPSVPPVGSVLGVGREASLLGASDAELPLQDMSLRSPNKYLYMRCRPCRAEESDEYVHQDALEAVDVAAVDAMAVTRSPRRSSGPDATPRKYARTLYRNDWAALGSLGGPASCSTMQDHTVPLRPEPVPCYIRGEPGVPVVVSPTRTAPPPPPPPPALTTPSRVCPRPRVQIVTCKADVEPAPRPSPHPAPHPPPATSAASAEDALDEDVLNRISHDLDYLLSGDIGSAPAVPTVPSASAPSAGEGNGPAAT